MAVAGLHNLSAFGPFYGESQPPASRQWSDEPGTSSTRPSSLLQMWRELEGDQLVSHSHRLRGRRNGSDSEGLSTSILVGQRSDNGHDISEYVDETENQVTGSGMDHDDNSSIFSEQSSDLGEIERERVRQIFGEWMSSGAMFGSSNGFHLNNRSGPQWLGENECERVRTIREWVQMNTQQRNNQGSVRDGSAQAGLQIEQVHDGLVITYPENGARRRSIRRLCGRQTLLDLLQRAQCERKEELQGLMEKRRVSDFTHRNRIQALLRGRFLRNERLISDERPSSVAATELGLLRQRHTVSGLREGFLSKLENSASTSLNSAESDSSSIDQNNGEPESTCRESKVAGTSATSVLEIAADGYCSQLEFVGEATEVEDPVLHNVGDNEAHEQEVSFYINRSQQEVSLHVGSSRTTEELVLDGEVTEQEVSPAEGVGSRHGEDMIATITNEFPLETEDINHSEHYELRSSSSSVHEAAARTADLEGNLGESDWQDASAQVDEFHELVTETEESAWQQLASVALTEWAADSGRESTARSWQESSANQLFRETSDNDAVERDQMQESQEHWQSHNLQEAIDSWLDMPSGEVDASARRIDTFYYSDDDNVHNMELWELFSRRRVSSLLRSSFRESLDQVLQSHVERQGHASSDWEIDIVSSSPSLVEQDRGQLNGDQAPDLSCAADTIPFAPTSTFFAASQPLWDGQMEGASLPHNNLNLQLGMEVVNELRIDMARLQQRLNNMQRVLEQCMDMQIELQRLVRQEVSAALNRSILTRDASKGNTFHDESQWDYVRRGICCLCRDSNIDSLLYRCGHMCTCSNCADKVIHGTEKCPMCQAPVVEAVQAYFIQ